MTKEDSTLLEESFQEQQDQVRKSELWDQTIFQEKM